MSYTHLTARDRYVISHLNGHLSYREIAPRLGRHHTTISREIKRNKPPYSTYWYYFIERDVERKRHRARCFRRQSHLPLIEYVEDKLRLDWPPEAISARLKLEHPHDERMRVSHETVYRWIYLDAGEGASFLGACQFQSVRQSVKSASASETGRGTHSKARKAADTLQRMSSARADSLWPQSLPTRRRQL